MVQSRRLLAAALVPFFLLASQAEAGDAPARPPRGGKEVFIVELAGPPLARYRGGVPGLAATHPRSRGERKLDAGSGASRRYVEHLRRRQGEALAAAGARLGRDVAALRQYTRIFNGMALELTPEEADLISRLPGVRRVQPDVRLRLQSDNGPAWIGAPGIWDGSQTGGLPGTKGEGVVIGIVDSGINMDHPSFADVGGDAYNHTNPRGAGSYVGWCDPSNPDYDPALVCNDKLIGVWSFDSWDDTPEDELGHGTQLAGVAAGNVLNAPLTASLTRTISGVAPHANLIAYDACDSYGSCYSSDVVAAIDQAVEDGVDVLNVSFAGSSYSNPWSDSVAQALLGAREAGVFVTSAAGNGGSYFGSIVMPANAPWVMAVGASTHSRRFTSSLANLSGGVSPPATLRGVSLTDAYGPAAIVDAADYGDDSCSSAFPAGTFSGQIVYCSIYPYSSGASEAANVKAGGAGGVVLAPWYSWGADLEPIRYALPTVLLSGSDGDVLETWLSSGTGHAGRITATVAESSGSWADVVPGFSASGPGNPGDVLRPDVLAPGVEVLAASSDDDGDYRIRSGTSFSSAMAAGAAALLIDLHPGWTPAEVQSALMTTAQASGLRDEAGAAVTSPLRIGAGRLNLGAAARAGLVLDETAADFEAANPANGGAPQTLNLASLADDKCVLGCSWTRTVRSTLSTTSTWFLSSIATPAGTSATITPSSFTLGPGATQTIQIQLQGPASQYGWTYGSLTFTESGAQAPPVRLPIATRWVPQYGLTVSKAGNGSGRVTSSPAGIDCGPTCSAIYPDETTVLLTPTPDPGSAFVGWGGWECYGTENPCSVEIWGGGEQVTAYFDLQPPDKALANRVGYKDGMNPPVDGGTWRFYYADLPAGTGELVVDLLDVTGEVVLYVNHASKPTWNNYSCYDWDYFGLPNRRCMITAPAGGRWWIGVNNDQTGPIQYSVRASWGSVADQALSNGIPLGDFVSSDSAGEAWKYYYVDLAGGDSELVVDLKNLSADADLFVRHAAKPDRSNYSCNSASVGTAAERCTLPSPAAGRWWIGVNNFSPGTVTYDVQASWVSTGPSDFYTVAPCRLVDTRQSYPVQSGQPRSFLAAGHCGVPATAKAVALNVTVVAATAGGSVTVYPADLSVPTASAISFVPGRSRASNALVRLSTDGEGRLGVAAIVGGAGQVHVILDVAGYFE